MNAKVKLNITNDDFFILKNLQKKDRRQYFIFRKLLLIKDFKILVESIRQQLDNEKTGLSEIQKRSSQILADLKKGFPASVFRDHPKEDNFDDKICEFVNNHWSQDFSKKENAQLDNFILIKNIIELYITFGNKSCPYMVNNFLGSMDIQKSKYGTGDKISITFPADATVEEVIRYIKNNKFEFKVWKQILDTDKGLSRNKPSLYFERDVFIYNCYVDFLNGDEQRSPHTEYVYQDISKKFISKYHKELSVMAIQSAIQRMMSLIYSENLEKADYEY